MVFFWIGLAGLVGSFTALVLARASGRADRNKAGSASFEEDAELKRVMERYQASLDVIQPVGVVKAGQHQASLTKLNRPQGDTIQPISEPLKGQ
jgi:hypothetical protein